MARQAMSERLERFYEVGREFAEAAKDFPKDMFLLAPLTEAQARYVAARDAHAAILAEPGFMAELKAAIAAGTWHPHWCGCDACAA